VIKYIFNIPPCTERPLSKKIPLLILTSVVAQCGKNRYLWISGQIRRQVATGRWVGSPFRLCCGALFILNTETPTAGAHFVNSLSCCFCSTPSGRARTHAANNQPHRWLADAPLGAAPTQLNAADAGCADLLGSSLLPAISARAIGLIEL
jgi:hypothetical protein